MAEIRTKVLLTNAVDDCLSRSGQIDRSAVRQCEINAAIDPTRIFSTIPIAIMMKLGLPIRAKKIVDAEGEDVVNATGPVIFAIGERETMEEAFVEGQRVIIGRTVLAKLQLRLDEDQHSLTSCNDPLALPPRS